MKKRSQRVKSLDKIVTVAAMAGSMLKAMYSVVMVASGIPISNGIPIGIDFTTRTIAAVMVIMLQETDMPSERNTRYCALRLKIQVIIRYRRDISSGLGLFLNSFIDS
jgi:hypothetical protein